MPMEIRRVVTGHDENGNQEAANRGAVPCRMAYILLGADQLSP